MSEEQQKYVENEQEEAEPEEAGAESESDDKRKGRRKIDISFIENKSRRHITFSKRKAGIMKKAYELATLTGTQVLLLVASETGHVYTFATPKLQPLITNPEGKNLIQACLNAPDQAPPEIPKSAVGPAPPPQGPYAPSDADRAKAYAPPQGLPPQYVRPKPELMRQMEDPHAGMNFNPQTMSAMNPMQGALPGYPPMPQAHPQYQNSQFFPRQGAPSGQPGATNSMSPFAPQHGQQGAPQSQGMSVPQQMYPPYHRMPQQMPPGGFSNPQVYQMRPQMHPQEQGAHEGDGSEEEQ